MRQKCIEIKGKRIFYYESRDHGNPVVFVHGISSSSSVFIRQMIDSVLSYEFRFIALDIIGHGYSDFSENPTQDYSITGLSDFLVEFSNALEIDNAVYIGHNTGGNIILEAYTKLKNTKGIVLLSSVPFSVPLKMEMYQNNPVVELFSKAGIDDSDIHQIAASFVEKGTKYPDFIPEIIRKSDIKTRQYFFESVNKGAFDDQIKTIKEIQIPIAVYWGEYDQIINFDYLNSIEIPNLWRNLIQIIPDVGHLLFYESPADFNISLEAFLNHSFNP